MQQRWPRPDGSLDISEKFELQNRLKELGYYDGEVDGNFGSARKQQSRRSRPRTAWPRTGSRHSVCCAPCAGETHPQLSLITAIPGQTVPIAVIWRMVAGMSAIRR